jgi:peptidoglycan pentaglycine glycine transferase (the first glycine)
MNIVELSESDKSSYNQFIASQPSGSFLQSWEWGEWQKNWGDQGKKRDIYRFALVDDGEWTMAIQLVKTNLGNRGFYYLYAPYGPVVEKNFKFQISNFKFLVQKIQKQFSDSMFIRLEPRTVLEGLGKIGKKTVNIQPGRTLLVDLKKPMEQLLREMHPKTRYNIKIAQRHEVVVEREFDLTVGHGLFFDEAIGLIVETAKRQKYYTHPRPYYEKLINFFAVNNRNGNVRVSLYKAKYQNKILSSAVMVDFGGVRTYLFGGSSMEHRNVMAPYALHSAAIQEAQEQGFLYYDFDGLETSVGKEAQFARFKEGFGGFIAEYPGAYDVIFKPLWYTMYTTLRRGNRLLNSFRK